MVGFNIVFAKQETYILPAKLSDTSNHQQLNFGLHLGYIKNFLIHCKL
jgi:hypothetical protein